LVVTQGMSERLRYKALCTREGGWWAVDVPDVPGVHPQAKRLDQAESMARDAIALMLEVPSDSFDVEVEPVLDADVDKALEEWIESIQALEDTKQQVAMAIAALLILLVRQHGLSYRDAGRIVGLSHQRVQQILKEAA
jgi:predicted RNase H-like HicB family nuclease